MNEWRFIDTGPSDGPTNMAVDSALLDGVESGTSGPLVRVYAWDPPTVSTGNSQRVSRELDLAACEEAGFGVVRRPTGGRAVLHAGELTYSVVGRSGVPPLGGSIAETYDAVARALLLSLRRLGVVAELATVPTTARGRGEVAPPCFVSAGRSEVVVEGRKLVGSAQRRLGGAVLQHGSVLLNGTHTRLADVLRLRRESDRKALRAALAAKTTDLTTLLGRPVSYDEVAGAMRFGFSNAWDIRLVEARLTHDERESALRLATQYGERR
jgi:lipoate-protein ligase A